MSSKIDFEPKMLKNVASQSECSVSDILDSSGKEFIKINQNSIRTWNQHSNEFHAWICLLHFARK